MLRTHPPRSFHRRRLGRIVGVKGVPPPVRTGSSPAEPAHSTASTSMGNAYHLLRIVRCERTYFHQHQRAFCGRSRRVAMAAETAKIASTTWRF